MSGTEKGGALGGPSKTRAPKLWPTGEQWRRWSLIAKASFVGTILAVIAFVAWLASFPLEWWRSDLANPKPETWVHTTESEINIRIRAHAATASMVIDFSVLGRVKQIQTFDTPTSAN